MQQKRSAFRQTPAQYIVTSFVTMIFVGAILLTLPFASSSGQSAGFLNALFTSTSAACVTGLTVLETATQWSIFGKIVIILLIQFGALGAISILTLSMMVLQRRITLRSRIVIQAAFNQHSVGGMVRFVRRVAAITLTVEAIGAVLLAIAFYKSGTMTAWQSIYNGIFHSISAFCNAGFDIIGASSLVPYQNNGLVLAILIVLIIFGGIGFIVWGELIDFIKNPKKRSIKKRICHLSVHTKIICIITFILLLFGTVFFLVVEWNNPATMGAMSAPNKVLSALFQSVTLRTCGFFSIPQGELTDFSKLMSSVFMIIGGSPGGTAGGMKTATLGVIIIAVWGALQGKTRMEVFGRTLPAELLQKALTVIVTLVSVMFLATIILYFSESAFEHSLIDIIFEVASATGTVGLSTGITPNLSSIGKLVIICCMFIGRLSPVTVAVALNLRMRAYTGNISYPEERVIIG